MTRTFKTSEAQAGEYPLLIGLMGPPGGGKTYSALRLATGICRERGGEVFVIDTEGGRAAKYAGTFKFQHVPFEPPYKPSDFLDAIRFCVEHGAGAIVIDSASDEHEGEGGVLDWHDAELQRMAGDDWAKRERVGQASWIKPKASRRTLINGMLRITVPQIFCFRAREKVKQIANDRGKMTPTNVGYQPIAPMEIVHQLDLNCLLPPRADGVPVWKSEKAGEDFIIKLPQFLQPFIRDGEALSEDMGQAFARWARGGTAPQHDSTTARQNVSQAAHEIDADEIIRKGANAAEMGVTGFAIFWNSLSKAERVAAGGTGQREEWLGIARLADQGREQEAAG